jgi:hypothetical protein
MRVLCLLLTGALGLLAVACGGPPVKKHEPTPVSQYKELLPGRWQVLEKVHLVQGYEFGPGDKLKMTVQGLDEPIEGTFTWTGDRELRLDYRASEKVRKDYAAAVRKHKAPDEKLLAEGKGDKAAYGIRRGLDSIPDELAASETVKVVLGEEPVEVLLVTTPQGTTRTFHRPKE